MTGASSAAAVAAGALAVTLAAALPPLIARKAGWAAAALADAATLPAAFRSLLVFAIAHTPRLFTRTQAYIVPGARDTTSDLALCLYFQLVVGHAALGLALRQLAGANRHGGVNKGCVALDASPRNVNTERIAQTILATARTQNYGPASTRHR